MVTVSYARKKREKEKKSMASRPSTEGSDGKKLYDAAAKGDTVSLSKLLEDDPLLVDRVSYISPNKTPLHVATSKGHLHFVRMILNINPQLAKDLDSHKSSALHVAADTGYSAIAYELLRVAPEMCLDRDSQGRNPVHIAAIRGHVEIVKELVRVVPLAAREKIDRGLTTLHLCVQHDNLEAMKILLCPNLINAKDDDGETILHMAVRNNQVEIIEYLIKYTKIDKNAKNSRGETAGDILLRSPEDSETRNNMNILRPLLCNPKTIQTKNPARWLSKKRDAVMVVAILIATMAFQAGVTPPGGVWGEDYTVYSNGSLVPNPHKAGESIMAYQHARRYKRFMHANTLAFVSSLSTILLLISGLPFRSRLLMWVLMLIIWAMTISIAVTYAMAIVVVTPKTYRKTLRYLTVNSILVWCGLMSILLVGHTVRILDRFLKKKGIVVWRPKVFTSSSTEVERMDDNYQVSSTV